MTNSSRPEASAWLATAAWLGPRRLRAHATILALCLWGVCAVDLATPGVFDRAGNIKFQDFLSFYVSGCLIHQGRSAELYDDALRNAQMLVSIRPLVATDAFVRPDAKPATRDAAPAADRALADVRLPNLYGPQVGLLFVPLARLSFQTAAWIWVTFCAAGFFGCVFLAWKCCPALHPYSTLVVVSALAFPPLFHFFMRGQISVLPLACFTAAFLAFRAQHNWLAGMALGLLIVKPQFLVAIPLVLLLAGAWRPFTGLVLSAATQLAFTTIYFGPVVMQSYLSMLWHPSRWIASAELGLAPIQMHSLRSFWTLLIPWPNAAFALYAISSCGVIAIAAAIVKFSRPLALRFSALTLAAVLVSPHLFVYDLLVLAPVFLLLADWMMNDAQLHSPAKLRVLLYLSFVIPLLGPLSRWTHLQLSVPVFLALLWTLWLLVGTGESETHGHKLASNESGVV